MLRKTFKAISAIFLFASTPATSASINTPYVWLQLVDTNKVSLRAITYQSCTDLNASVPMTQRVKNSMQANPGITVCEALIDLTKTDAATVTIEGHDIDLPRVAPARVAILGDTGCRVKGSPKDQICSEPEWPFHALAKAIKKTDPDLIIHVGDYIYRNNCGGGRSHEGCRSEHQLRDWKIWKDDFFDPASELLPVAPWIFVRGNHEDCQYSDRAWRGWALFLSMEPDQSTPQNPVASTLEDCLSDHFNMTASKMVRFPAGDAPALNIFVHDSADGRDPIWQSFAPLTSETEETWIATHVPFVSFWRPRYHPAPEGTPNYRDGVPQAVSLILSGHVHLFQFIQETHNAAIQVIAGGSGTKLDFYPTTSTINSDAFTYVILDRGLNGTTIMTTCAMDDLGNAFAWASWTITLSSPISGPTIKSLEPKFDDACTMPAI